MENKDAITSQIHRVLQQKFILKMQELNKFTEQVPLSLNARTK